MKILSLQVQYDLQLIEQFKAYQTSSGKSWAQIADSVGVSSSVISQYLKLSYPGKVDAITERVRRYLKIELEKTKAIPQELEYTQIDNSESILNILSFSHVYGSLGAIVGDTGTSKSTSIRKYTAENSCIYLEANRSYKFPVEYLRKIHIHSVIGKDGRGTMNQLCSQIIEELKGKNVLLIIDQADYLNIAAIDIFRTINEESKQGVVFIGLPSFLTKIRGNLPEVRQVRDRLRLRCELKPYSFQDAQKIINHNWPGLTTEIQDLLYKKSEGSLRILSSLIFHCRIQLSTKGIDRKELNFKTIEKASNALEIRRIE